MKNKAVFLDRDGVINESLKREGKPYPPKSLKEFVFTEKIKETLDNLKSMGYLLIVVTNQPDVARGKVLKSEVGLINNYILSNLPITMVYCCYHDDKDNCDCRKPKAGMIKAAAQDFKVDLNKSFVVGDRWRDIDAGHNAGVKTIFIDYGYKEKLIAKPDYVVKKVHEISSLIRGLND